MAKYINTPVVIDGTDTDDDTKRVMHLDRQQGYLDALTELSRQWGMRVKDMGHPDGGIIVAMADAPDPDGKYIVDRIVKGAAKVRWY